MLHCIRFSSVPSRTRHIRSAMTESEAHIFSRGPHTHAIDRAALFGKNRQRLIDALRSKGASGLVILQGGKSSEVERYDTDGEKLFQQEGYFHWAFGTETEDQVGVLDIDRGDAALFVPKLPDAYAVWMGEIEPPAAFQARYAVQHASYLEDLPSFVLSRRPPTLHVLQGENSDSGKRSYVYDTAPLMGALGAALEAEGGAGKGKGAKGGEGEDAASAARYKIPAVDASTLHPLIASLRRLKTPEEISVMRYANKVCAAGHVAVMQSAKPGDYQYQLESTFLHHAYSKGGARHVAYTPIVASGKNAAVLHYGHAGAPNSRRIADGDLVLADMGLDYCRYASDITTTWPVNGRFSEEQRVVYEGVLEAHQAVIAAAKPGASWPDLHVLSNRIILTHLKAAGLVQGSVDDLLAADIGGVFMPHGLGHFLGIDTHDVGGYLDAPPRIQRPGLKSLRTTRKLEEGNVITVEPGCYFNDYVLRTALADPHQSKYLVPSVLDRYRAVGGVRIEDNIVITKEGCESLTHVPRTVKEIEEVMAGKEWKV